MAWEQRGNKDYYYRKRRDGDRVVSEYVGNDFSAHLSADEDCLQREKLLAMQRLWLEHKTEFVEADLDYEFLLVIMRELVNATFLTSGYHPHKGQWRKKRHDK